MNRALPALLALSIPLINSLAAAQSPQKERELQAKKTGLELALSAGIPEQVTVVELRIASDRNRKISKYTDVSPLDPRRGARLPKRDRETWYPVVDVSLEPGMEGVAVFEVAPKVTCAVNGMFYREKRALTPQLIIPGERLEAWENSIWVDSPDSQLGSFYLRRTLPVSRGKFGHVVNLLSDDWSGVLSLHAVGAGGATQELARTTLSKKEAPATEIQGRGLERKRLIESLVATVGFTLRSQNRNPHSLTDGGLHLFYDVDASMHRSSHWVWGWGPSVKMLLEAAKIPEVASRFEPGQLRRVADEIGRASLRFAVNKPIDGMPTSRWDRSLEGEYGYREALTPADALFLAGWAWVPLYEATGDKAYLEATTKLAAVTERLCREFALIPQNFWPDSRSWSDFTLDESGFGAEGLAELFRVTKDPRYRDIGRRYMEQHLAVLQRDDGLWERSWFRSKQAAQPTGRNTRGLGWAMEGLLATHRMIPDGRYLDLAKRMAEHFVRAQHPSGYWAFAFDRSIEEVGIAEKGTALWSLLFYMTHSATTDTRYLVTARKALRWLLDNQYTGPDREAHGSIVGWNPASAVGYRPWFRVSCTYASAFFGLAAMEELKLAGTGPMPD